MSAIPFTLVPLVCMNSKRIMLKDFRWLTPECNATVFIKFDAMPKLRDTPNLVVHRRTTPGGDLRIKIKLSVDAVANLRHKGSILAEHRLHR